MTVTVTGAGGGGGGGGDSHSGITNSRASGGGGGGGGATVKCTFDPVNTGKFYFTVGDGGIGGAEGALDKDGNDGRQTLAQTFVRFYKNGGGQTQMSAGEGSPGLGGPAGTATGTKPGGAGGRGSFPSDLNCTVMDGESGTAGGTNGPPQKAGAGGTAGSGSCGGGTGGAGGEGGMINNSTYLGTPGSRGKNGADGCVSFEY